MTIRTFPTSDLNIRTRVVIRHITNKMTTPTPAPVRRIRHRNIILPGSIRLLHPVKTMRHHLTHFNSPYRGSIVNTIHDNSYTNTYLSLTRYHRHSHSIKSIVPFAAATTDQCRPSENESYSSVKTTLPLRGA